MRIRNVNRMNEIESLKYLKDARRNNEMLGILPKSDIGECIIKALEELQMYHDGKLLLVPFDVFSKICEENDAYKEIGTPDECRSAVEKQKKIKESFEKWKDDTSGIYGADDETIHFICTLKKILRSD